MQLQPFLQYDGHVSNLGREKPQCNRNVYALLLFLQIMCCFENGITVKSDAFR